MKSKAEQERIKQRIAMKEGQRCALCGSEFMLTVDHQGFDHLNHRQKVRDPQASKSVRILCATCHFMEDHEKAIVCEPRAAMRKYEQQCAAEENRGRKLRAASARARANEGKDATL